MNLTELSNSELVDFINWAENEISQLNEIVSCLKEHAPLETGVIDNLKKYYYLYENGVPVDA